MQLALGHRISADATPPPGSRARLVAQLLPVWKLPAWYMLGLPGICQNEFDILDLQQNIQKGTPGRDTVKLINLRPQYAGHVSKNSGSNRLFQTFAAYS